MVEINFMEMYLSTSQKHFRRDYISLQNNLKD